MHDHPHDHPAPSQRGGHRHQHAHAHDRGLSGILRYLRHAPRLWRSPVNDAVVAWIAPQRGERVLDIGAGMGAGVVVAAATGAVVVAVEPTPFMRIVLRLRRSWKKERKNIEVVDAGAESLPGGAGSVDAIYAVNTMHHWVDPDRAATELARVLRPSGRLLLVDENFDDPSHPDHGLWAKSGHAHPFTMVAVETVAARLRKAGLANVDTSMTRIASRPVLAIQFRGRPD